MRTTIFLRILIAALVPVFLVLLIVIGTARNVIYMDGLSYAKEYVRLAAKQISDHTSDKLENAIILQGNIREELAGIEFEKPAAKSVADGLLSTLLLADRELHAAWFVFEPGVFPGESGRYDKTFLRMDGEIREVDDKNDELPESAPWYDAPLSSGHAHVEWSRYHDYGVGQGPIYLLTLVYPIITDEGRIIGCLGMDIRYEDLFPVDVLLDEGRQSVMLVSVAGTILFSPNAADIGDNLWEHGFENTDAVFQALRKRSVWLEEIKSPDSGEQLMACLYPIEMYKTGQSFYLYRDIPADSLYKSFSSSMQIIIVTGVLGLTLLSFCVFFTTRSIVRHVKRITDGFYRVANGNAGATLDGEHIPIYDTNVIELDILQSALINMMVQLRKAHDLRLEAAEAEVEKEKLIASAQAKTNFFAAMSHEIRTPMNAILGISEIMLYEGGLTAMQEKYMQDIKISADALLGIIDSILDVSKMESGKMELHFEHYNFRAMIDNIVSMASHLAINAKLQFAYKPDSELPFCLYGDGTRLRQVLMNLIGNAIKFTREGCVELHILLREETIRFDVVDTGIGLREEEVASAFESFKRLDTRRNREVKGAGLGLSISKNLTELMGGSISVKSVYGKGSTFSVTLPLVLGDKEKVRRIKPGRGTRYADSLRVLIVDDNEINLGVSSGLLRAAHGILCDTAASGWDAVDRVQKVDYDLIFMDHMMPELDGVDTTQRIRELGGKYREIPIIALTANAVIGTSKELIDGGMNDFLAKPIQSDRLQQILDTWVPEEKRLPCSAQEATAAPGARKEPLLDLSMKSLLEKESVHVLAGLENIGFDEGMYLQSLRLLREKIPQAVQQLESLLDQQNMRDFHIYAHGLKGSLESIGASARSAEAQRLEAAALVDDLDACRAQVPLFSEMLWRLHRALCEALPGEEKHVVHTAVGGKGLKAALERLCSALERYDYGTITDELNLVVGIACDLETGRIISRVKLLADNFDYPGAAALIRAKLLPDAGPSIEPIG